MSQSQHLALNRQQGASQQPQAKKLNQKSLLFIVSAFLFLAILLFSNNITGYQQHAQHTEHIRVMEGEDENDGLKAEYAKERKAFLEDKEDYESIQLLESNLNLNEVVSAQLLALQEEEYLRLDAIHHFSSFKKELPFCLIVQNLDFATPFLFEYTLNSIFNQNYSNYKAVLFSFGEEGKPLTDYFHANPIKKSSYVLVKNKEKKGTLENILAASRSHCPKNSISLNIVGNAELIGKNVLKMFNAIYQTNKISIAYSNFYHYNQGGPIIRGYNTAYSTNDLYTVRRHRFAISAPVAYMTQLALKVDLAHLKDKSGAYLDLVYDQALLFPMLDISCRTVMKIDGYHLALKEGIATYEQFKNSLKAKSESSSIARQKERVDCDEAFVKSVKKRPMVVHKQYLAEEPILKTISQKRVQDGTAAFGKAKNYEATPQVIQELGEYLYKDEKILRARAEFQRERIEIANNQNSQDNKKMIKYNLRLGRGLDKEQQKWEQREEMETRNTHKANDYPTELPFCIVVQSLPFQSPYLFRFEYTLNSIFNQNYSNFFAVIINNDPHMDQYARKYLSRLKINKNRYAYIQNYEEKTTMEMLHTALTSYCSQDSYTIVLDGAGQMLGRNALRVFNSNFQQKEDGVIYSCAFNFKQTEEGILHYESTDKYTDEVKSKNQFRNSGKKYAQLLAFRTELYLQIDVADFKDSSGQFMDGSFESHMVVSLMELSCGKVDKILGVHYLNNQDIRRETNDKSYYVQQKKRYSCLSDQKGNLEDSQPDVNSVPELKAIAGPRKQKEGTRPVQLVQAMDFLKTNQDGLTITQYLYGSAKALIMDRKKYQQKRENRLKIESDEDSRQLVQFNMRINQRSLPQQEKVEQADYTMLQGIHKNIDTAKEVPMCVVIDRLTFRIPFQFEYTLNSVFNQNYSNFFVVLANDGSRLGDALLRKYLHFYDIPKERYAYLENKEKLGAMAITLQAVESLCSKDSFVLNLAGNDELFGRNVLKVFSAVSQNGAPLLMYSNSYFHWAGGSFDYGIAGEYNSAEIKGKDFRNVRLKHEYPFFFHSQLLRKVNKEDLLFAPNTYFKPHFERAITVPMFELSCGRTRKVWGVHYLFNKDSKGQVDEPLKSKQFDNIAKGKKYECLKEFQFKK